LIYADYVSKSGSRLCCACRSLKAFIFILEAEYHANRTEFCLKKNLAELKVLKASKGSIRRWTDIRKLKGNYILEETDAADVVDIRSSLNRR